VEGRRCRRESHRPKAEAAIKERMQCRGDVRCEQYGANIRYLVATGRYVLRPLLRIRFDGRKQGVGGQGRPSPDDTRDFSLARQASLRIAESEQLCSPWIQSVCFKRAVNTTYVDFCGVFCRGSNRGRKRKMDRADPVLLVKKVSKSRDAI
jgi:hypothetical protein